MAPKPPHVRRPPAKPGCSSGVRESRAPRWPPNPHTFVAPRRSRGAPLVCARAGPRDGPQTPTRSSPPGEAGVLLWCAREQGPEMAPKPPHVRRPPAKPGCSSGVRESRAPRWPPNPHTFVAPRRSRGAPLVCARAGPRDGPQTPTRSSPPGEAGVLLWCAREQGPEMAPTLPSLGPPRRSRGASRRRASSSALSGPRIDQGMTVIFLEAAQAAECVGSDSARRVPPSSSAMVNVTLGAEKTGWR